MTLSFQKATKAASYLRMALTGPSSSGKTFTALALATGMSDRVAVLDSEHGSASLYADQFSFDTVQLTSHAPERYIEVIQAAQEQGYGVLVIDSLSHAWAGTDGLLEEADKADTGNRNQFAKWGKITPRHNKLIEAILSAHLHIIATMRSKTAWAMEQRGTKQVPVKVGLEPVQRPGVEYEFGIVAAMDAKHTMSIEKTRVSALDGLTWQEPGAEIGRFIIEALNTPSPYQAEREQLCMELKRLIDECGLQAEWTQRKAAAGGKFNNEQLREIIEAFRAMGPAPVEAESSGEDGVRYEVNLETGTCTCPGFEQRGICQHLRAKINEKLAAA